MYVLMYVNVCIYLCISIFIFCHGSVQLKTIWFICVRYGQLSGMVEPIAGILGALAIYVAEPLLPYSLAFAAGAMIYVVVDDIIPEAQAWYVISIH